MQSFESYNRQLEDALSGASIIWPETLRKRWASIFRILYNMDPLLESRDSQSILQEARELVQVVEDIRAGSAASKALEAALLRFDQIIFHSIVNNPAIWASLGRRMHSAVIYQEAIIHLVGTWRSLNVTTIDSLEPCTRDLCQKKHQELVLKKKTIECRILSYYPGSLHCGADGNLSCASYANDIYMWMAIAFFRQWFSHSIVERRNYVATDGGAGFYRRIGAMESYLTARDQAYFNLTFPMSTKGRDVFEAKVRELKTEVRQFVVELLVNNSKYTFVELPYLTCCQVDEEDMPWDDQEDDDGDDGSEDDDQSEASVKVEESEMCIETQESVCFGSSSTTRTASHVETPGFNNTDIYSVTLEQRTSQAPSACGALYPPERLSCGVSINNGNVEGFMRSQTDPSFTDSQLGWLMDR